MLKNILFYTALVLIPVGYYLRFRDIPGGDFLQISGFFGVFVYFFAKSVRNWFFFRSRKEIIIFQILLMLMSVTLFSRYLYYMYWDYPGIVIVILFILANSFYFIKYLKGNSLLVMTKLKITNGLFLLMTIPLLGSSFYKSPRELIPKEWYDRYDVSATIPIDLPYNFKYKETQQLNEEASSLRKAKEFKKAIAIYQKAIKLEPKNAVLYFDLSECYAYQNKLETAVALLDTAIMINNTYAAFYNNRGLIYYTLKRNWKAIENFEKAIRLDSLYYVYYANLALPLFYEKMYKESCEAISRAEHLGYECKDLCKRIKGNYCNK